MRNPVLAALLLVSCAAPPSGSASTPVAVTTQPPARSAGPRVVTTSATETSLTVVYSRPMKHLLGCGTKGLAAGYPGTIDGLESNITSRYYASADPDFDEMLGALWEAKLNGDCTAVTFSFVHGIGPGSYPLQIVRVQDVAGNPLDPDPTVVTVTVVESGPPLMTLVQAHGAEIRINFSEAIASHLATDAARYRVDRSSLPAGSSATCVVRTCAVVVLRLPAVPQRIPGEVTVVGLHDLGGRPFATGTETQAISLMAGQSR